LRRKVKEYYEKEVKESTLATRDAKSSKSQYSHPNIKRKRKRIFSV
jgi:hypothetical protein